MSEILGWLIFIALLGVAIYPFLKPHPPRRYEDFPSNQWFYDGGKDS